MNKGYYHSPIGWLCVETSGDELVGLSFVARPGKEMGNGYTKRVINQLEEYFLGRRNTFDLAIKLDGTRFQTRAWEALMQIPYGETVSYKEQAIMIGCPRGFRAVGNANGKNPIAIIVPCHRVIASNNTLGGYASGLNKKAWLLNHENKHRGA